MQAAQIDQASLKAELVTMPAEGQRTVQELLRAHVSAGRTDAAATGSIPRATLAHKKIELKLKFWQVFWDILSFEVGGAQRSRDGNPS